MQVGGRLPCLHADPLPLPVPWLQPQLPAQDGEPWTLAPPLSYAAGKLLSHQLCEENSPIPRACPYSARGPLGLPWGCRQGVLCGTCWCSQSERPAETPAWGKWLLWTLSLHGSFSGSISLLPPASRASLARHRKNSVPSLPHPQHTLRGSGRGSLSASLARLWLLHTWQVRGCRRGGMQRGRSRGNQPPAKTSKSYNACAAAERPANAPCLSPWPTKFSRARSEHSEVVTSSS